jgi:hypothetical protein
MVSEQQTGKDEHNRGTGIMHSAICVYRLSKIKINLNPVSEENTTPHVQFAIMSGTEALHDSTYGEWSYGSTHAQPWL